ncbi:uncharacterized protein LOC121980078 [Zingiber officinale]|uniref:uncharacterized protein LOC121980078 n=1 Tax=Zingiber officinale TaxID=94328 RepID=UPI001C4CEC51|nr:uncharacterized protein LOC121980078 [Zingiber officinale]
MPPKYMSGYQKKKRKLRIKSLIQSQAGDINKYFTPNLVESKNVAENLLNNEEDMGLNDDDKMLEPINMDEMGNNNNEEVLEPLIVDESNFFKKDGELVQHETLSQETCYDDPGKWAHEASKEHMECMTDWLELERRLQKNQTIDPRAQVQLNKEKEHWKHVLHRIIAIVQRLAKNNLAFRGSCEKLYVENNGLFLQMVEMIAKFDPIMNEHLWRIKDHETYTTYLGSRIQNELIQMLAGEESHVESVKLIKEQTAQIRDVLLDLTNDTEDPKTKSEAESLALYELEKFEFLLGVVIWYKLLFAINTASKLLQSENMDIDVAIKLLQGIIIFLEEYRESGFDKAMVKAKEMASEMGIEAVFREKQVVRRKKQFDESSSTEIALSAEESFRVNYFLFIVDQAHSSIESRFAQFKKYQEIFGFLFNVERLQCSDDESLLRSCRNLESSLAHNGCSDVNGDDLFSELTFLKCSLPKESKSAIDVLDYLKKMDGCFPNAHVAYKILLTIPVTVATAERSFSKLKLIKTFFRSTMSQERLNGLAMLSIEKEIIEQLDYTDLINIFAAKTVRRVVFN